LLPEATTEALLQEWSAVQFEQDPYLLVAVALGGEPPLSENLWHFDAECIEDHGAYAAIAGRLRDLARGDLPIREVQDYVDVETKTAWLSFELDGIPHRWTCEVDNDWADPKVFTRFADLLTERGNGRRFTYLDTGGQDCVIGCFDERELKRLRQVSALDWTWLK
jgi:hypothetical protein